MIFLSDCFETNNLKNTYAISVGLKSVDHDAVEDQFLKETMELSNGVNNTFYSMHLKRNVKVHFEIIASLADQPERRSMNKIMLGNSLFLSRFRYSGNLKKIGKFLPPCVDCLKSMRNHEQFDRYVINCQKCVNWNFLSDSELLTFEAPDNYPSNQKGDKINLRPMNITFEVMKKCVNVANHKLENGNWTDNNVIAYCGVHGINLASSKKLIERVKNKIAIDHINSQDQQSFDSDIIEVYNDVKNDFVAHKNKFTFWKGGPY